MFLAKYKIPTLDTMYQKVLEVTVQDVEHLSLFMGPDIPTPDSKVWVWSSSTLYRFMKSIGVIYGVRVPHYEHTKESEDILKIRDDYLYWIEQYREKFIQFITRTIHGFLRT